MHAVYKNRASVSVRMSLNPKKNIQGQHAWAAVFPLSQDHTILSYNLPILKESGPPEVLLTHMAKKSRSAQAVSIFYDSSWVLPRGCPCHSHLKNIQRRAHHLYISQHQEGHIQAKAVQDTVKPADIQSSISHSLSVAFSISLVACWESVSESVKLLLSDSETHREFWQLFFHCCFSCIIGKERVCFLGFCCLCQRWKDGHLALGHLSGGNLGMVSIFSFYPD